MTGLYDLWRRASAAARTGPPDADLLDRFRRHRDGAAFAALVDRHGPLVYGACRRLLPDPADVEDAFQASFLVLVRRPNAAAGRPLGPWLHRVAVLTARAARRRNAVRLAAVHPFADATVPATPAGLPATDARADLDAALAALPGKYRVPVVLCHLQGWTRRELADHLGCPESTASSLVGRGLARLRRRLGGDDPAVRLAIAGAVGVPAGLAAATGRAAALYASSRFAAALSPAVTHLTDGVLRMFVVQKLTVAGLVLSALVAAGVAAGVAADPVPALPPGAAQLLEGLAAKQGPVKPPTATHVLGGWGEATDPDGDCAFTIEKDRLTIAVPGSDHSLGIERKKMNAPRVLRPVDGDFIAQVAVSGDIPAGAKVVVPDRRPFHGAGLVLWVDEKTYVRLERAEVVRDGTNLRYANFELRTGGEFTKAASDESLAGGPVTHLRLERRGGRVYGAASADGVHWTSFDPIPVDLPRRVRVGVAAGHNTSAGFRPTFEGLRVFAEHAAPVENAARVK